MRRNINQMALVVAVIFSCYSVTAQEVWKDVKGGLGTFGGSQKVTALLNDTIDHQLWAAGTFTVMGGSAFAGGIAIWDDANWSTNIHSGGTPSASSLCLYDGKVFLGTTAGTVGYYDGTQWQAAGTFNNAVSCLAVYHNKLYAGGDFTKVNGVTANKIACYDGTAWSAVGGGISWSIAPAGVWALGVWNDKLYAGGAFDHAGSVTANFIASWNDTAWAPLGSGTYRSSGGSPNAGYVYAIGSDKNNLYVGGEFDSAGGVLVNNIARWDGNKWYSMGGINNEPYCILVKDSIVYVAGSVFLNTQQFDSSYGILSWNGHKWSKIDNGLNSNAYALAVYDNVLYVGGQFDTAGEVSAKHIARLVKDVGVGVTPSAIVRPQFVIFPNPVTDELRIADYELRIGDEIIVTNLLGQTLLRTTQDAVRATPIDVSSLPPGMYLLRVRTKEGSSATKFVKQ